MMSKLKTFTLYQLIEKASFQKMPGVEYKHDDDGDTLSCEPGVIYFLSGDEKYEITRLNYKDWQETFYLTSSANNSLGSPGFFKCTDGEMKVDYIRPVKITTLSPQDKQDNYVEWLKENIAELEKQKAAIDEKLVEFHQKLQEQERYTPEE